MDTSYKLSPAGDWTTNVVKKARDKGILPDTKAFDDFIWNEYNKPWLESAMQRGDEIILWSDPKMKQNLEVFYKSENIKGKSFFSRELEFIQNNASKYGYNFSKGIELGKFSI